MDDVEEENEEEFTVGNMCDVLIIGGGPVGLMLAISLGKQNVNTIVIEARKEGIKDPRFVNMNSATLEHFANYLSEDEFKMMLSRGWPEEIPYGGMLVTGMAHKDAKMIHCINTAPRKTLMEHKDIIDDWTEGRVLGSRYARQLPLRLMQSRQEGVLLDVVKKLPSVTLMYDHSFEKYKNILK